MSKKSGVLYFFDNFIIKKSGNKLIYKFYTLKEEYRKTPDSKASGEIRTHNLLTDYRLATLP